MFVYIDKFSCQCFCQMYLTSLTFSNDQIWIKNNEFIKYNICVFSVVVPINISMAVTDDRNLLKENCCWLVTVYSSCLFIVEFLLMTSFVHDKLSQLNYYRYYVLFWKFSCSLFQLLLYVSFIRKSERKTFSISYWRRAVLKKMIDKCIFCSVIYCKVFNII